MLSSLISQENLVEYIPKLVKHFQSLSENDLFLRWNSFISIDIVEQRLQKFTSDSNNDHYFLFYQDQNSNDIIGVCQLSVNTDKRAIAEIAISVSSDYQSVGIGTFLFLDMKNEAKKLGIKKIEMYINCDNGSCLAFAKKMNCEISFKPEYKMYIATLSL